MILRPLRIAGRVLFRTVSEFIDDRCPQMAAAISFYTLLSLPALLVLVLISVEPFLSRETVVNVIESQARDLIGAAGAEQITVLLENATRPGQGGPLVAIASIGTFLFGATVAFAQLQAALNTTWQVGPDPERGSIVNFLIKRFFSFLMIMGIGLLIAASLVLSALVSAFGEVVQVIIPFAPSAVILRLLEAGVSLAVLAFVFTVMLRYLPDARVRWTSAFLGGTVTAVLFTIGKTLIAEYLARADPASAYGAAGSLALVLLWIYYSSMILLFGAEFTQVWMGRRGRPIQPIPGAVRIIQREERYLPEEAPEHHEGAKEIEAVEE